MFAGWSQLSLSCVASFSTAFASRLRAPSAEAEWPAGTGHAERKSAVMGMFEDDPVICRRQLDERLTAIPIWTCICWTCGLAELASAFGTPLGTPGNSIIDVPNT